MRLNGITSCYIGPAISPEEFISEHFFLFLIRGEIHGYDGNMHYTLKPGESCLVRKNHLARYNKQKEGDVFEKVVVIFDEAFLKTYASHHGPATGEFSSTAAFLRIRDHRDLGKFIRTIGPHYDRQKPPGKRVTDKLREDLLGLLLRIHPEYAGILFDFGKPGKLDLRSFMQKNYKFNVSVQRLAFMTGRSLSAFKRDFAEIFQQTPSRWLVQRRLQEAYFLLNTKKLKASDIYLDLGFEDLSHFSFAFKKQFGVAPAQISKKVR